MKIICTEKDCIYNREGECNLTYSGSAGDLTNKNCVYFVRSAKERLL